MKLLCYRKKPGLQKRHHIGKAAKNFKKVYMYSAYWLEYAPQSCLTLFQVSSAPPPTIPKYPLPALEAPPMMNSRMLEGIPSFPPSPSSSHHSFSQSESPSTLQQSSFSDSTEPVSTYNRTGGLGDSAEPVSADNEAGDQFAGIDRLERDATQDKDTQGIFLTQVN